MCDLFSWVELTNAQAEKHGGAKVLFLTDETVKILRGRGERSWSASDVVGHTAIEKYYKETFSKHEESRDRIPPVMAEMVMAGKLNGMIEGILGSDKAKWPIYNKNGCKIKPRWEDCEKNPVWVRKSIVYFCDNYTIDKNDLAEKKKSALSTFGHKNEDINDALYWTNTKEDKKFWDALWYLQTGKRFGANTYLCAPWTFEEKELIDSMPKV
jgi:hypothetical protein